MPIGAIDGIFPPIEYPSRSMMCKHMNKGAMQGRLCEKERCDAGYASCYAVMRMLRACCFCMP